MNWRETLNSLKIASTAVVMRRRSLGIMNNWRQKLSWHIDQIQWKDMGNGLYVWEDDDDRDVSEINSPDGSGMLLEAGDLYNGGEDIFARAPSGQVYTIHGDRGELWLLKHPVGS